MAAIVTDTQEREREGKELKGEIEIAIDRSFFFSLFLCLLSLILSHSKTLKHTLSLFFLSFLSRSAQRFFAVILAP